MKKFASKILKFFIRIALRLNLHILFSLFLLKVTRLNYSRKNNGILVFGRMNSDMDLITQNDNFNYYYLLRLQSYIPSIFLDKKMMSQRNYFKFDDKDSINQKLLLRKHLSKILKYMKKYGNIKFILVASWNYFEHQEWANAGKEIGVKLIVYYKESVISEGRLGAYTNYITEASNIVHNIDKVLVYGETGLKQFKNTKIVKNENIHEVGSLKTDTLYKNIKNKKQRQNNKTITLFAFPCDDFQKNFDPNTHYSQIWQAGYWCPKLWRDVINLYASLSNIYTDTKFLVKTKGSSSTRAVKSYIEQENFENLLFTHDMPTHEIYEQSSLIIGANSTVILEMLSTDIPCLIPQWNESVDPNLKNKLLLTNKSNAYNSASNSDEFKLFIKNFIENKNSLTLNIDPKERKEIVNYYLHSVDGKVFDRIENVLNEVS